MGTLQTRGEGRLPLAPSQGRRPQNCVWEITLACNLRCLHCGTRAGRARIDELSTEQCLDVADQLADLGCELVTLSGGEPTLRADWDTIGLHLVERGVAVNMITNGLFRREGEASAVARRALSAGLCNLGVSIDGDQAVHDRIRGKGTFARSMASVRAFATSGMATTILTTVSRWNLSRLEEIRSLAIEAGAAAWRLQLAKPMGSMDEQRDFVLTPEDLLTLMPLLVRLKKRGGIRLGIGDSLGYYGVPDRVLRNRGWRGRKQTWQGCQAGMRAVGIEADGGVKGCLSMQARVDGRDPFLEGNLKEHSLAEIWAGRDAFAYNRQFQEQSLTGPCRDCRYGSKCRGGARCVSSAVCGKLTEDPYCYYRVAKDAEGSRSTTPTLGAAAIALALSVGGCGARSGLGDIELPAAAGDAAPGVDAASPADAAPAIDAMPDALPVVDSGEEPCCSADYGVEPMPVDASIEDAAVEDAAVVDSAVEDSAVEDSAVEDAAVEDTGIEEPCCELDYGFAPPPFSDAGAEPDADEPVVGNDYGMDPPPSDAG